MQRRLQLLLEVTVALAYQAVLGRQLHYRVPSSKCPDCALSVCLKYTAHTSQVGFMSSAQCFAHHQQAKQEKTKQNKQTNEQKQRTNKQTNKQTKTITKFRSRRRPVSGYSKSAVAVWTSAHPDSCGCLKQRTYRHLDETTDLDMIERSNWCVKPATTVLGALNNRSQ